MNIACKVSKCFSANNKVAKYLVEAVTWLTVRAKTACSSSGVGERTLAEATMMLQRLAIFPTEDQAVDHIGQGVCESESCESTKLGRWSRALGREAKGKQILHT